jgi:rare lipoprotein A (peptidoglycan hydrolase)
MVCWKAPSTDPRRGPVNVFGEPATRSITIVTLAATLALAAMLALAFPSSAHAMELPAPLPPPVYDQTVDEATRRALELERTVADLQAEQTAISTRIGVTSAAITEQSAEFDRAKAELKVAQDAFNERAIGMYKFTGYDELALLLDASSWQDLMTRATVLSHVLDVDRRALEEASVVEAQAAFQASQLDGLRAQDIELRQLLDQRVQLGQTALAEQQALIAGLTPEAKAIVITQQAADARTRQQWKDSSIPIGTLIRTLPGKVLPYPYTYLVSAFHPRSFRTTGITYSAVCSWYGPGFNGKPTASGQVYNQDDFTCASRTLAFGTWLALTRNGKRIVVVVTDRGPYVSGRDLDLSKAAADALGFSGVESVMVEVVTPGT